MSKLNHLFLLVAALSFCLKSAIGSTLKSTYSTCPNCEAENIQSEIQYTSVCNFLLKGSNATSLVSLTDSKSFRSLHFRNQRWEDVEATLAVLRVLSLPESGAIRANVHEIRISGLNSPFTAIVLPQIEKLIPQLENLSIVRWERNYQLIPPSVLRAIESLSPSAKLYYSPFANPQDYRTDDDEDSERAKLIPGSASLYHLKVHDDYWSYPSEKILSQVFDALVSSPNINELDLSLAKKQHCGGPNAFDFASRVGERLPPLKVLRLNRYDFDAKKKVTYDEAPAKGSYQRNDVTDDRHSNELRRREYLQEPLPIKMTTKKSNMELWLEAMDWSQVHTLDLKLSSFGTLNLLRAAVPNLSKLLLQGRRVEDSTAIVDFVANLGLHLQSLELLDLRLSNFDNVLDAILSGNLALSLKHLTLTGRNDLDSSVVLRLNSTTIHRLLRTLPRLESLSLAIPCIEPGWNYPLLQALISHHGIRHLTLHVDIPDQEVGGMMYSSMYSSSSSVIQPLINATSTPGLFRYMRKHKSGLPLDTLTVNVNRRGYRDQGHSEPPYFNQKDDDSDKYYTTKIVFSCSLNHIGLEVCKNSNEWSSDMEDFD